MRVGGTPPYDMVSNATQRSTHGGMRQAAAYQGVPTAMRHGSWVGCSSPCAAAHACNAVMFVMAPSKPDGVPTPMKQWLEGGPAPYSPFPSFLRAEVLLQAMSKGC